MEWKPTVCEVKLYIMYFYLYDLFPFVFQFAIQKVKYKDMSNYNIARCTVWVWNLVADTEEGT